MSIVNITYSWAAPWFTIAMKWRNSMIRSAMLVALTTFITACIPVAATRVPAGLEVAATQPSGVVFGSIGRGSNYEFSAQTIFFRRSGSTATGSFTYARNVTVTVPVDIEEGEKKATLFVARLPPGRYELSDVHFFVNYGQMGSQNFRAEGPIVVPFEVVEGRAIYLGEFLSYPVLGKNLFGAPVFRDGYFVVTNEILRDLALLTKRHPEMRGFPVDNLSKIALEASVPSFRAR
jgi:hypothetical protein